MDEYSDEERNAIYLDAIKGMLEYYRICLEINIKILDVSTSLCEKGICTPEVDKHIKKFDVLAENIQAYQSTLKAGNTIYYRELALKQNAARKFGIRSLDLLKKLVKVLEYQHDH